MAGLLQVGPEQIIKELMAQGATYEQATAIAAKIDEQNLAQASMESMTRARNSPYAQNLQNVLAPYEHRAFLREMSADSPILGTVAGGVMSPGYEAMKALPPSAQRAAAAVSPALDVTKARSKASLESVKQGLLGTVEGIGQYMGLKKPPLKRKRYGPFQPGQMR
jgi:acetyl-CoA acetyltransferase